jgi:hypothetical protein
MQVGEVVFGAGRAVERFFVGGELYQVARDEAGCQTQMAQDLHQQPGRVATRAEGLLQRLLAALHAGFHADGVGDVALQTLVERDQEIVAVHPLARHFRQPRGEPLARRLGLEIGREFALQLDVVVERIVEGAFLDEVVEGVDHRHVGDHLDVDRELARRLREH